MRSSVRNREKPSTRKIRIPYSWIFLGLGVAALMVAMRLLPVTDWLEAFNTWVADLGWVGYLIFILFYIVATIAFVPGSVITIGAGFAFGLWKGTIAVSLASTAGAAMAFLLARYFLRERFTAKFAESARFQTVDKAIAREGIKIVFLLRLTPVMPFNLGNYLFGLTGIPFWHYVLASWIGMLPGTLLYVYIGTLGRTGLEAAAGEAQTGKFIVQGLALMAIVAVTLVITRIARKALRESPLDAQDIHRDPS